MSKNKKRKSLARQAPLQLQPAVPKSVQQRQIRTLRIEQLSAKITSGPIPSADELLRYQSVQADFPERIVRQFERRTAMAEAQSMHRMGMETRVVKNNIAMERLGWASATTLGIVVLVGSIWLIHDGKSVAGLVGIVTSLASLLGLFVWSRRDQVQEVARKRAADMIAEGVTPDQLSLPLPTQE